MCIWHGSTRVRTGPGPPLAPGVIAVLAAVGTVLGSGAPGPGTVAGAGPYIRRRGKRPAAGQFNSCSAAHQLIAVSLAHSSLPAAATGHGRYYCSAPHRSDFEWLPCDTCRAQLPTHNSWAHGGGQRRRCRFRFNVLSGSRHGLWPEVPHPQPSGGSSSDGCLRVQQSGDGRGLLLGGKILRTSVRGPMFLRDPSGAAGWVPCESQ